MDLGRNVLHTDEKSKQFLSTATDNEYITVVSGLPRSGTSMMMKMLDHGSMPLLIDNLRIPDIDNPKGYYEYEQVKDLEQDNSWLDTARGKAVKIVSPILQHLKISKNYKYKIIFMLRDLDEILASQRKMAERLNEDGDGLKDNLLKVNYSSHLEEIRKWLEETEDIDVIYINYRDVLNDSASTAENICRFLNIKLNTQVMAHVIDSSLYRQRVEKSDNPVTTELENGPENELIMDRLKSLGYL